MKYAKLSLFIPKPNEKLTIWQGGALNLNQATPALKQLNLNKFSDASGFKVRGCSTKPGWQFFIRFWYASLMVFLAFILTSCCSAHRQMEQPIRIGFVDVRQPDFTPYPPAQGLTMNTHPFMKPKQEQPLIVVDAGHGGEDFGTHSLGNPKFQEKYLNLSTAMVVKNLLLQSGFKVLMTRSDDTFVALDKRAQMANEQNPKMFVSIHYNSAPSKEAQGIEVFYYKDEENKARTTMSKGLAQSILDKTIKNTGAKSRGVKHGNYLVLRETEMPAILIEGGFLTSESEMEKIKDAAYMKSIALGIVQGIQDYLAKEPLIASDNAL